MRLKIQLPLLFVCLFLSAGVFAQDKKVALVSFYSDKKIGGTGLGTATEALIDDPNFNLKPILNKSYEKFIKDFAKDFPFKLIDQSEISGNEEYKKYESKFMADTTKKVNKVLNNQYNVIDGMVFAYPCTPCIVSEENRDECNLGKIFNSSDGVLFVSLDYEFEPRMGGLAAGITAYVTLTLYDKKCDKVFRVREFGKSGKKVPAVAGIPVMKAEKIFPLCEDATEVLFEELEGKLGKIVKKSAKNL